MAMHRGEKMNQLNEWNESEISYEGFFAATRQHFFACQALCSCHAGFGEKEYSAGCTAAAKQASSSI